jgi:hypothetical protein
MMRKFFIALGFTLLAGAGLAVSQPFGPSGLLPTITDGATSIANAIKLTFSGCTVGGSSSNATVTCSGSGTGTVTNPANLTTHGPLVGGANGTTDAKAIAAMTNGQIPIGSTGADPVPGTITMGAGLNGATGAGSFTITPAGRTAVADANCGTLTNASALEAFTTVLTAARSCTLPAASTLLAGQRLCFVDEGDGTNPAINGANTVTLNRAGSDKINGATSFVMGVGYAAVCLESDASAKWSTVTNQNISAQAATSNNFLTGIGSDGVFTRAQPAFSNLSGAATPAQIGGSAASHAIPVDVAGTSTYKVVPDCTDTAGNHINYTQSTDAFSCGTSSSGGGSSGFTKIATRTASNSTQLLFGVTQAEGDLSALGYKTFMLDCNAIKPGTANAYLYLHVATNNTPTPIVANYLWSFVYSNLAGVSGAQESHGDTATANNKGISLFNTIATNSTGSAKAYLNLDTAETYRSVTWSFLGTAGAASTATNIYGGNGRGIYSGDQTAITAITIDLYGTANGTQLTTTNALVSGQCTLYGLGA